MIYRLSGHLLSMAYVLCLLSCSSSPPIWLESRPQDQLYWHGIGFASFDGSKDANTLAREYAIHEISSQIKVNISSEMDIIVKDFNGSIDNAITSVMRSRVDLLLPELEFMGQYKNKSGVHFYARLNKEKYRSAIERLRENAKKTVLGHIAEADKKFGVRSFLLLQKAWLEILPFNDEPIETYYDGRTSNLYSLIKQKSDEYEGRLSLDAILEKDMVKTFVDRANSISIQVKDTKDGRSVDGIPVNISMLGKEHTLYSNSRGLIEHDLETSSLASSYDVRFKLDQESLYKDFDHSDHRLDMKPRTHSITVNVIPAHATLISSEKNINRIMDQPIIGPALKEHFNRKMEFVNNDPDLIINIEANTAQKSKRMGANFPYFVFGNAVISFKDATTNVEFFSTEVSNIKGGDFASQQTAGIRAYDAMAKQLISQLETSFIWN